MSKKKHNEIPSDDIIKEDAPADVNDPSVNEGSDSPPSAEDAIRAELAAEKERYLRLAAEYDNFRKRSQKERESLFCDIQCDTVSKLLPVYDNLERALKQETEDAAFFRGVEITMEQLLEILSKIGIKPIPSVGEKFNPELHNAVMHIEDDKYGDSEITEEFQKGFIQGDKVIRFSMVVVAN